MNRLASALFALLSLTACADEPISSQGNDHRETSHDASLGEARWAEIVSRCAPPAADEPVLYGNEFTWGYEREAMATRFDEIYDSGKRLLDRAFYDEESETFELKTSDAWGSWVTLPKRLVENVAMHIQQGLARGYVDHVFFPDMGHSHFFIPQAIWDTEYADVPVPEMASRTSRMLDDPNLLVLYHTAEQLQMLDDEGNVLDDPWIAWRFHTRSLVGDNAGLGRLELLREYESKANTSRDYPGHRYYGAGFNISASVDGCFPYEHNGEVSWFDISLSDLPRQVNDDDDGGFY